ncbi:OLC1v1036563C1 [Oldenlandia corymbosa var. corymbosa]|uniref:OLC1v1036563C1 n=1 Tax=Oldenlandia corymbosa var. corymbosa TaxID=529605 RepID=A0AAV1CYV3_OLDCO|nr:OLC1v1036563C1 [Oldenlandia corymbosa var. corymbosa]
MLKAAQSPLPENNQIQRPKSGRKALLPKNPPATTPIITPQKVKPTKPNAAERIDVSLVDNNGVNKENVHVQLPLFVADPVKIDPVKVEDFDLSLAEELNAIREKRERLKRDKEETEKMLGERELVLDMQMKELRNRGEMQKMLEMEVDRLYRLNQLKVSCMGAQLVWIGEDKLSDAFSVAIEIPPSGLDVDEELDEAVDFFAPECPGRYISYWRMASPPGKKFGQWVWVLIQVDASSKEMPYDGFCVFNLNLPPVSYSIHSPEIISVSPVPMVEDTLSDGENFNEASAVHLQCCRITPSSRGNFISYPNIDVSELADPVVPSPPASTVTLVQTQDVEGKSEVEETLLKDLEEMGFKQVDLNKEILRLNEYDLEKSVDDLCGVSAVVCRENEQNTILEFCKRCVEQESSGSMYICGCPGTGKSLIMEKVKDALVGWAKEAGFQPPDVVSINCTSLVNSADIFSKILGKSPQRKKNSGSSSPLKVLQNSYSPKPPASGLKMTLIVADEMDYLITKDRSGLHDIFMLTTLPFSRCILIGVANAIDLTDSFLPKLQSLNCRPCVITFRAYSKDQIIAILQQRLAVLPYIVLQPQALELCARRVAAASGDLRKALCVCRSAIEMLEAEIRDSAENLNPTFVDGRICHGDTFGKQDNQFVRVDHMALALSKAYKSPVVDTIQSLPQHQQIILCSAVKLFCGRKKKDTTISELNKYYVEFCKSTLIPPLPIMELSNMCGVLADQGLIKLGQAREDKLRRVMLKVDEADINFALQPYSCLIHNGSPAMQESPALMLMILSSEKTMLRLAFGKRVSVGGSSVTLWTTN